MSSRRALVPAGLGAFVGLVALQHGLRPDLPAGQHFISEYARGWTQPLQVAAFGAWAVAIGACIPEVAAIRPAGRPLARAVTCGALAVATAGAVLAGAFTTQTVAGRLPEGLSRTPEGRIHDVASVMILAGLVVAALAGTRILRGRRYRLTVAALGVALAAVIPAMVALGLDAPGIGQRAIILIGCVWHWRFAGEALLAAAPERRVPAASGAVRRR